MIDRRRRTPESRRTASIQIMLTPSEAADMRADADAHHEGNISALLRAAWREYRQRRRATA